MRYTNRWLIRKGFLREDPKDTGNPADGGKNNNPDPNPDAAKGGDGQGGDGKKPDIKGDLDPDRAARAIQAARDAEAKAKADKKAADDRVAAILKAAGLTPDGKEDPAEALKAAAAERDEAAKAARQTTVELAVYKSAGKAGGDPDALLDSRNFLKAVKDLDPSAADFGDKVTAAIKDAVKANPKLAVAAAGQGQGPGRQGADHSGGGGGGGGTGQRSTSLGAAVSKAYSANQ